MSRPGDAIQAMDTIDALPVSTGGGLDQPAIA
jgi:hypothetical protein